MSQLLGRLREQAVSTPLKPALEDQGTAVTYGELWCEIVRLAESLKGSSPRPLGLLADNSCAWALADLAAHMAGITVVPLPPFFSPAQLRHVIRTAGINQVLTDRPERLCTDLQVRFLAMEVFHGPLMRVHLPSTDSTECTIPAGTVKVTFTSGTTGEPRGVCLGRQEIESVAEALRVAAAATGEDRHLCLMPLATLLENIGGVYVPLLAGATACLPRLADVGLSGSSQLDAARLVSALKNWGATSAITVPQMLQAIVAAGQSGTPMPAALRYVAVGGAPVSMQLLQHAQALGLPVYQGYGLSECASVVAANGPGANRVGSVGRPLPHVRLEFAQDGEILIHGIPWRGYLRDRVDIAAQGVIATGDLGYLDGDGFVHVTGRKKNIFITSFGRNVAPEWVECELVSRPPIRQAAVFGEARSFNSAVIVTDPSASIDSIAAALDNANRQLPDYARIRDWVPAKEPFTAVNGMLTINGRLRRSNILAAYAGQIDALYRPSNSNPTP